VGRVDTAAATRSDSTSTRRISFSTNGPASESGRRLSVMNGTRPLPPPPSSMDSWADAVLDWLTWASRPAPGSTMLAAASPRVRATMVATRK
jgi:hypothetical protein